MNVHNFPAANAYLSVNQVAERLGVSVDTIWRWSRGSDFPKPYRFGGSTRWKLQELLDYEQSCRCGLITMLPFDLAI
jgi:predicted DNA-binding transcriptional regulator AlpA